MMSAAVPIPGDDELCLEECSHADCQAARRTAACFCIYCGQPIGFGARYVLTSDLEHHAHPVHEDCYQEWWAEARWEQDKRRFLARGMLR